MEHWLHRMLTPGEPWKFSGNWGEVGQKLSIPVGSMEKTGDQARLCPKYDF